MRVSSSTSSFSPSFVAASENWLAAFGRAVLGRFNAWYKKRAVLEELYRLDQRTLYDLRIHRCDFHSIAEGTYQRGAANSGPEVSREQPAPRLWQPN
jgi:uncharacterized protein YjiS (DUF1127 family)